MYVLHADPTCVCLCCAPLCTICCRRVWTFRLNPGLAWGDVSLETRLRLKTLPVEAVSSSWPVLLYMSCVYII